MHMTRHARVRCQQRTIPPLIREWLLAYGAEMASHGATKRYFDKAARKQLAREYGSEVIDRMGNLLDHYLVVSDTAVITAGIRSKRVKRT